NTRIQVEHPVTEMVTGVDLVREQIRIAAGEPMSVTQEGIRFQGHAIECRITAEDPVTFTPAPGRITTYLPPGGFGVRVDSHCFAGYTVPPHYDSLVAKVIAHGASRAEAIARMRRALAEFLLEGIKSTIPFHARLLADPRFVEGAYSTTFLETQI
ncbi:MAG: acetyl-CoA carboxylase biotin carboxylase subunit, partial [Candidatus Rokubacteria bacterium]|nr:acetyl-CoA carboxylase biotin carboxylase subunit [Candidatus Rokubacteria bacterium]